MVAAMRYLFIVQVAFFILYGMFSGAAWHELYDERIEQLKAQHEREVTGLLVRLPLEVLGEIQTRKL